MNIIVHNCVALLTYKALIIYLEILDTSVNVKLYECIYIIYKCINA